jgi:hypothetical protein
MSCVYVYCKREWKKSKSDICLKQIIEKQKLKKTKLNI